ncbi:MAG: hypothetical protein V4486_03685 [Patescibacteria group bacterium]
MNWALRRQLFYIGILLAFFIILGTLVIYPRLHRAPSCVDGKQNGTELGIDCGGSCTNACQEQVEDVSILWARSFRVVPGRYNAVAYLTNHNRNAVADKISYRFRFADKNNLYIGKREGTTYIPRAGNFAIFEPAVDMGGSLPVYTTFEFTSVPQWIQAGQEKLDQLKVLVSDINFENPATAPHLSATITNSSLLTVPNVNVIAILYDESHNAVNASSTFLDELAGEQVEKVDFTWPEPITANVVAKEIIPIYNVSNVKWR